MKWLGKALGALGVVVLFVVALVAAVVVHLDTGAARAVVAREVTAVLAPSFKGRIVLERMRSLGLGGIGGADVRIEDPRGAPALTVRGASVRWMTWTAARSALFESKAPLYIRLGSIDVDRIEAILDSDPEGKLYLAEAFEPRTPSPPNPQARGLRLEIGRLALRHLWAHGTVPGAPRIDADLDAFEGGMVSAPDRLEATIQRATLLARGVANGADVRGALTGHFLQPSDPHADVEAGADWKGLVGRIGHSLHARLEKRHVDATVDVPAIDPADLHAVLPQASLGAGAKLRAEAHGPLSRIALMVRGSVGPGDVAVDGVASVGDDKTADLRFDLRDVDAHAIEPSAPASSVGARGEVHARSAADGTLTGSLAVLFLGGPVAGRPLPQIAIAGSGERTKDGAVHAAATVDVREPAAPTRVTLKVEPRDRGDLLVEATLRSDVAQLDAVPALNHQASGELHVDARGSLDVKRMSVDASLDVRGRRLASGGSRVDTLAVKGSASGPVADPKVTLGVRSQGVVAAGRTLTLADVDAQGRASALAIRATIRSADLPDVDGDLRLTLRPVLAIDDARLHFAREGESAVATIRHAAIEAGTTRVDDARIEGLGAPLTASVAMSGSAIRLRAATGGAGGIDLARVGRLAALDRDLRAGTVAIDADVDVARSSARGHARVELANGALRAANDVGLKTNLDLAGRKFRGTVHAEARDVGVVDLDAKDIEVAGAGPLLAASWRQIWGALGIDGHVDLARAAALIPADDLPFDEARGKVTLKAQLRRDDLQDVTPDVDLDVSTDGLVFAPRTGKHRDIDGVLVIDPPPWRLSGIDVALQSHVDGDSGRIDAKTRLYDKKGELAKATLRMSRFPYPELFQGSPRLRAALTEMPVEIDAAVPTRGLGSLPNILKQNYLGGKLEGDVKLRGSVRRPAVDLRVALKSSHFSQVSNKEVLDLEATTHYDGAKGTLTITGVHDAEKALDVQASFDAPAAGLEDGSGAWDASARASFSKFPLEAIPVMDEKLVSGLVDGDCEIVNLHRDASAKAALTIEKLKVGTVTYKAAKVSLGAAGGDLHGQVRIEQDDGFAQTDAHGTASWGAALAPALEPSAPLDVDLSAKNFRVGVLLPFVEGTLDELDGRLDASTRVELQPATRKVTLSGQIAFDKGVVEAAAGGGELHDVTALVKFMPDGTITLEKLSAAGLSGHFQANGSARFDGTQFQSARGLLVIPAQAPIPLSGGGTEIGDVDGRIELASVTANPGRGLDVKVVVPHVRVALPSGSTNNAESLKPLAEGIHVGAHRGRTDSFVVIPLDPTPPKEATSGGSAGTHIAAELRDVQVTRGADIAVDLGGKVNVDSGANTAVTGTIHLKPGGHLTVQGKKFAIESGTVSFAGGDASNPEIVVKAGYTARDGTVVYASFVGPLKTGKVTLSSDPPLPEEEIVQLLLFGTADGAQAQNPSADPTTSAIGTVGGEAAQPLNHLLNQWGLGAVSFNVDTNQSSTPKPEVAVQVARDISFQLAVVLGVPPPGVNPDTTLFTLDWRFASRWSLAATLGDAGTTIFDVLWKKRY